MLLLPLLSLAALWAYAANLSLGNALTLEHENTIGNRLAAPLGRAIVVLQGERRSSVIAAVAPGADPAGLNRSRKLSDAAVAAFLKQAHNGSVRGDESAAVRRGVDGAERALGTLPATRQGVDAGKLTGDAVLAAYTAVDNSISEALRAMTILPNQDAQDFGQALYTLVPAGDVLSQEDALISAAAASPAHRLDPAGYSAVVQDIGTQRTLTAQAVARFPAPQRTPFLKLAAPDGSLGRITAMEDQLIAAGPAAKSLPFPIESWRGAYDAEDKAASSTALDDISLVFTRTGPPARRAFIELVLAGLLGLIALIVSVFMSIRMARSLIGDVGRLHSSARNLTDKQLRDVVGRLRRGESVDVRGDMARPVFVNREMAELGAAFDALQLTAVELAQEDIRLHRGISDVFVNLARRSQTLVHRQLSMLDAMERHEENPRTLEELFRLDQLATRMRRYAEGLIIVSGAPPGRFWRHAVPAVDVVRGAIAETEDYARVVVLPVPSVGIRGRAAADVIHLLAELIENAEVFSPSDSEVRVSLGTAAGGLIIEIDDRGLGMPSEELAAANARIGSSLDVSTLDSTRLGLVTVGRLAQRHAISVSLRQSPYGGVNAVVLIPQDLLEWEPAAIPPPGPARPAPAPGQRHPWMRPGGDGEVLGDSAEPMPMSAPYAGQAAGGPAPSGPVHAAQAYPAQAHAAQAHTAQGYSAQAHSAPAAGWPTSPGPGGGYVPASSFPPVAEYDEADMIDGLPRRVPQASLARELLNESEEMDAGRLMDWGGSGAAPDHQSAGSPSSWAPYEETGDFRDTGPSHGTGSFHGPGPSQDPGSYAGQWPGGRRPERAGYGLPGYESPAGRPEQVRSIMSALQAGAARARVGHGSPPGDGNSNGGGYSFGSGHASGQVPAGGHRAGAAQAPFPSHNQYSDQGRHGEQ
ncbi:MULTISPECIES: sensor histidine kinase [unclassified Streptomyces]|uniref:sensor histidine kinase n=1 Tax=unclassified Streptomyces TaxID=2593676 RepID=UPI001369336E|nr:MULTISPECIES: nitrate- and nitrite sensing domain-containing protein [unclassified Streptomyces]MYS19819.1 hypothetical protein [Streptomyces sp. SID4948]